MLWASWNASIWSLSGVESLANWDKVGEGESLALLVGLLALLKGVVSLALVPSVLVAVESVVLEGTWASLGTDGMSEAVELSLALLVDKSWSSGFAVSGSVN